MKSSSDFKKLVNRIELIKTTARESSRTATNYITVQPTKIVCSTKIFLMTKEVSNEESKPQLFNLVLFHKSLLIKNRPVGTKAK